MARTTSELSDAQWAKLAPLLPPQRPRMGRPPKDHRLIMEAIVWLCRTGAPWRDLPANFGPWATVAGRFYRWRRQGVWDRLLAIMQADADARGELDGWSTLWTGRWCGLTSTPLGRVTGRPRPIWPPSTRGLPPILTSRVIGRRWAAAAGATPPSCTFAWGVAASQW
jgi:transposase